MENHKNGITWHVHTIQKSALLKTRKSHFPLVVWVMEFSIIPSRLGKVKHFPTILDCKSKLKFNVCMKMVNEFYVFITGLNDCVFVYELSDCGIDSCCCHLNFREYILDSSWWNNPSRTWQKLDQVIHSVVKKNHKKNHAYLTDSQ